eukprot:12697926-Alexandrium_andersonii.AAC.1
MRMPSYLLQQRAINTGVTYSHVYPLWPSSRLFDESFYRSCASEEIQGSRRHAFDRRGSSTSGS